jgi:dTDP-glucose 4,6-dehydratase
MEFVEDRPGHDLRYSLDSTRLRRELGWKPLHSFEDGIEDTVRWYANNVDWWKALADEKTLSATPWKLTW